MITTTTMNHLRRNVFWKASRSNTKWWQERKLLEELKVGQELPGCYLVEILFTGNTRPKL